MLALEQGVLAQARGLAVHQEAAVGKRQTQLGIGAQREDAAVHIDGGVVLHRAAVRGADVAVGVAVGLQHLGDSGQHLGALGVAHRAQCGTALFAGEAESGGQVQPGGVHAHEFGAQHRIEQRRAGAAAGLPAAGDKIGKQFAHGGIRFKG